MLDSVANYIRKDFETNPVRAVTELLGMSLGVGASILLALTTPTPWMTSCYLMWLVSSVLLFLCATSRGSTGLAVSYGSYFAIDVVGILRTLMS